MRKSIGQIEQIFYTTKHCEFTRHWIHLDFGFRIYRDLTKSATFQFGFPCCICLNEGYFFSVGWEGRGGMRESDLENWLTAKKKYPGYLPDFYHIFCNTNKTLTLNAKNNSSSICLLIFGTFEKQLPVLGTVSAFWH